MRRYTAKNVDDYIAHAPTASHAILRQLRDLARTSFRGVDERISWGVPFYYLTKPLAGFSVFTKHVTFGLAYPLDPALRADLARRGYVTGSKTVQIRFDQRVPVTAIKKIITAAKKRILSV